MSPHALARRLAARVLPLLCSDPTCSRHAPEPEVHHPLNAVQTKAVHGSDHKAWLWLLLILLALVRLGTTGEEAFETPEHLLGAHAEDDARAHVDGVAKEGGQPERE